MDKCGNLTSKKTHWDQFLWPGWLQLRKDFKDDPEGLRQIRQCIGRRVGHDKNWPGFDSEI